MRPQPKGIIMNDIVEDVVTELHLTLPEQFAKVVLGAAAGFLASTLTQKGVDVFVAYRRNKKLIES